MKMDPRQSQFLEAVLEADGARALAKATSKYPHLGSVVFPRTLMAWLEVVGEGSYDSPLPGVANVTLKLEKTEAGFTGRVRAGDEEFAFDEASLYRVAGSVAVALGGVSDPGPIAKGSALAKLGRSIDLLVKSRTLRKAARGGGAGGKKGPGQAAAPLAPMAPEPPQQVQPAQQKPKASKPKLPQVKVVKVEAKLMCPTCGAHQFDLNGNRYVGCMCFKELAKTVSTAFVGGDTYVLSFGEGWDADGVATVAESVGAYRAPPHSPASPGERVRAPG